MIKVKHFQTFSDNFSESLPVIGIFGDGFAEMEALTSPVVDNKL